jgi:hypothetical protein
VRRLGWTKSFLLVAILFLVLSVTLSIVSLFPQSTGNNQKDVIIDNSFKLSPNETYKQGLGAFHGKENITVTVNCPAAVNFSIAPANFTRLSNQNMSFTAGASYYEAAFYSNAANASWVHLQVTVEKPQVSLSLSWLTTPTKIMFLLSTISVMIIIFKSTYSKFLDKSETKTPLPQLNKTFRNRLLALVLISLVVWLILLAINSSPLATFNNWYTDHARDNYVSTLFLKDGLSVFSQPLGSLANQDNSHFMFVTWPQMPHLYPLGSIFLFLPFGSLLQSGVDSVLVYKLEIALFLVFAHLCLYFFLKDFLKKNLNLFWKTVALYIVYVSLVIYAAGGMFDSVAFFFVLVAVTMFLSERYDYFFLCIGISFFLKYQVGIFLLPLIVVGSLKLFGANYRGTLLRKKAVVAGAVLVGISVFTACLSALFLVQTRPELIMNSINAFAPNAQIDWIHQATYVLLTLAATLVYAIYMLNKNSLLSISAVFLLLPSFLLPYFQYWYIPFIFVLVLVPQTKKEIEATVLWLIFMVAMLSGILANPMQLFDVYRSLFKI